jgi:hypothetical protein
MNGLFGGMLGGGNKDFRPGSQQPMMPSFTNPLQGWSGPPKPMGGIFSSQMPAIQNFMADHPNFQNMFSKLGQGAKNPMTAFGAGMMGGGGWGGGIQPAMLAQQQQQQQQVKEWLQRMQGARSGGLGGGGLMGGPSPASIY